MKRLASILAALGALLVSLMPLFAGTAAAAEPGNQHFNRTWQRTDLPVAELLVSRTWMWGPEGNTDLMTEPYQEAPGGSRSVQYFDKSRMEITHPDGDADSVWYVTNGLLVVELITGNMQLGDNLFEQRQPSTTPVGGDGNAPLSPTYATFGNLLDADASDVGAIYSERLSRSGQVTADSSLTAFDVRAGHVDEVTRHTIAAPFWKFMNSSGAVYENGQYFDALLFQSPLFATGRPITEAYWAEVLIAGTPTDVLMQCFERRCLTYNPSNPAGWQVEAGNVGIHYYDWRYGADEDPGNGNPPPGNPPGNQPPANPGPGDPPPGDPPPGNPPPGDPPPGDPPPGNPPAGDVPPPPYNIILRGQVGGVEGPSVLMRFQFGDISQGPVPNGDRMNAFEAHGMPDDVAPADWFRIYRLQNGAYVFLDELDANGQPFEEHVYLDYAVSHGNEYCYYVTTGNQYGESARSDIACVDVPYRPDAPRLINPPDGYVSYDREITFEWATVPNATGYVICVVEPGAAPPHCDADTLYATWTSGAAAANGKATIELRPAMTPDGELTELYWTVAACNGSGYDCGGNAGYRQLFVDLRVQLAAPTLVSETVDPNDPRRFTFTWDLVQGAERYIICAAEPGENCAHETGNFYKSSVLGAGVDTYPLTIPVFLAPDSQDTNLIWSAAACDADLNCVWQSNTRSFTVELAPDAPVAPTLVSPADGYQTDASPVQLTWDTVAGAASYRVCLAYDAGDSCPNNATFLSSYLDASTTTWAVYTPEGIVNALAWTVAACDANNDCVWQQQTRTVTIDRTLPPPFEPPTLVDAVVDQNDPARFVFSWNLVQGAERYIVCVAEPGEDCDEDTGNYYKSSVLGPTVAVYPLTIPLWLAPDNQLTSLNWTVAACDADLNCVWQDGVQSITVDRR